MKAIQLNTASTDNSGKRREAGETIPVGTARDAIASERAKGLLARRMASVIPSTDADAKKPPKE